jgi:predicted nucleic acid-binding protein
MVLAEVLQGIRRNEGPELEELLVSLPFLPDDKNAWHEAGRLANSLERSGLRTPLSDVVVGIVARTHDCELLARDNHFHRIPGLRLHEASSHT